MPDEDDVRGHIISLVRSKLDAATGRLESERKSLIVWTKESPSPSLARSTSMSIAKYEGKIALYQKWIEWLKGAEAKMQKESAA
jgi:hypothetical protein